MSKNRTQVQYNKMQNVLALLYQSSEEKEGDQLFWETLAEPYRSILEDCYYLNEEGKFSQLKQITNSIKYLRLSYIKIGVQLYQVKYYKLYRGVYLSFKHYCEQELKYQVWRANQLIESARVGIELIFLGFKIIPVNESQARYLIKLNSEQLKEKWLEILSLYPPHKITAQKIEKVVKNERNRKIGTLKLPIKIIEEIEYKALEYGISSGELVAKMIQGELSFSEDKTRDNSLNNDENKREIIKKWEEDLQKLLQEKKFCSNASTRN
jgi:hypothetical protein